VNNPPFVSAIVVNWNGARDLERELPSLVGQSHEPLEVLVVDNGSTDDSEAVVRRFPAVRWTPLGKNAGFAGALNRGVESARGEWVLLLNNDMRFPPDFVRRLAEEAVKDEAVFAVDALQYDWEGRKIVHAATFLGKPNGQPVISCEESVPGVFIRQEIRSASTPVMMASGANLLARKTMFRDLGGLDGRYPIGHEDMDICWRAWMHGWKTIYVPAAVCWHDVGRSARISRAGARFRSRGTVEGRLLFAWKLLPWRFVWRLEVRAVLGMIKDVLLFRWERVTDRGRTARRHWERLPALWRERRRLHLTAAVRPEMMFERMKSLGARHG